MKRFAFTSGLALTIFSLANIAIAQEGKPTPTKVDSAFGWIVEGKPTTIVSRLLDASELQESIGETVDSVRYRVWFAGQDGSDVDLSPDQLGNWSVDLKALAHSDDGLFVGQNYTEVETYTDLGLQYQHIEEDYLRSQMALQDGQSLIVSAANESGQGHKNGFRVGDLVLAVDGEAVDNQSAFVALLTANRGTQRSVKVRRSDGEADLVVVLSKPKVSVNTRRVLGIYAESISELAKNQLNVRGGIAVTGLTEDSAAGKAGIVIHDVITEVDGAAIHSVADLREVLDGSTEAELKVDFLRMGKTLSVQCEPSAVVDEVSANENTVPGVYQYSVNDRFFDSVVYRWLGDGDVDVRIRDDSSDASVSEVEATGSIVDYENRVRKIEEKLQELIKLIGDSNSSEDKK